MLFVAIPSIAELWPILLIVVVLFGAKKLPELARAMGSSVNQFKKGLSEEASRNEELGEGSSEENGDSPA
jgi:sec-independent protein translocase protein TatA